MRLRCGVALVLASVWLGNACADPPHVAPRPFWQRWWSGATCSSVGCCRNDYIAKPLPCNGAIPRGCGMDDYCRKPIPCVAPVPRCGGPNDYCGKPLPCLLCPPLTAYLQCGPIDERCVVCVKR